MRRLRRLVSNVTLLIVLVAGIVSWLPLVLAGETRAVAATTPVPDQRTELTIGADGANELAADGQSGLIQLSAPFFRSLCAGTDGQWAQTVSAGLTAQLVEVELLLLRRTPDVEAPVRAEVRAVDDAGLPTETVLGHGSTGAGIAVHRSKPGWLTVALDAPVQVLRGQKVAIFPTSTVSPSGACYEWVSAGLDQYTGGSLAVTDDAGASFTSELGKDAAFRTLVR
jgi:hypothetical protein